MPAMTIPRLPAMIAASAFARRISGFPVPRALARIGLSPRIAEEKITSSASSASLAWCGVWKRSPSRCRRSVSSEPTLSEPLTSWPSSRRSAAIPLIPLPATPTRWIRWRSRVSIFCRSISETSVMIRLRISFHRFHDEHGCVFRRELRRILRHAPQFVRVFDQLANFPAERIASDIGFLQNNCGIGPRENLGVARLMVLGGVRERNQDGRQSKGGQLGQTGCAGTRDGEIGRAINLLHPVMKGGDVRRNIFALIIVGHEPLITHAGKMNHLERETLQHRERFDHRLVDSTCALAPTHNKKREQIFPQAETFSRDFSIDPLQLFPDRRAGDLRARPRKKRRAFLKSQQNGADHAGRETVCLSGNCVRLVNESGNATQLSREHGCGRSEAAHPEDGVRFEFPINAASERTAFAEAPEKSEDRGGKRRRQADSRQFLEPEFRAARESQRVDLFFGNEEH